MAGKGPVHEVKNNVCVLCCKNTQTNLLRRLVWFVSCVVRLPFSSSMSGIPSFVLVLFLRMHNRPYYIEIKFNCSIKVSIVSIVIQKDYDYLTYYNSVTMNILSMLYYRVPYVYSITLCLNILSLFLS